jgi:hypothetical protein
MAYRLHWIVSCASGPHHRICFDAVSAWSYPLSTVSCFGTIRERRRSPSKEAKKWHRKHFAFLRVLLIAGSAGAVDPADKCEADKLKEAGKYGFCPLKAELKAVKKSVSLDYTCLRRRHSYLIPSGTASK